MYILYYKGIKGINMDEKFLCRMHKFIIFLFLCSFILTIFSYIELSKMDYTFVQENKMDFDIKRNLIKK